MKKIVVLIWAGLLAVYFLTGCQPPQERKRIDTRGGDARVGDNPNLNQDGTINTNPSQGRYWGVVYGVNLEQMTKDLLSASFDSYNNVGSIDGSETGTSTGVRFWGDVTVNLNSLAAGTSQPTNANAKLRITVWDSYAAEGKYREIPLFIDDVQQGSSVAKDANGNVTANIIYVDGFGTITLNGQVVGGTGQNATFQGNITFANAKSFDGSAPRQGTLGQFKVPACGFFQCQ